MKDTKKACSALSTIEKMQNAGNCETPYYEIMENAGWIESKYFRFMTTAPINVEEELKRLPTADFSLCCALMTMLLREDHFCNGSFMNRILDGSVARVLARMKTLQSH